MSSRQAKATSPRKVRSWRTASGVRAEVKKGSAKQVSGTRMVHAAALCGADKKKSTCTEAVEPPFLSLWFGIQFP